MNRRLTVPLPGNEPAHLTFPEALTPELLDQIEHVVRAQLRDLRPATGDDSASRAEVEYASWRSRGH